MSGDGRRIVYRILGKGLAMAGTEGEEALLVEEGRGESEGIRGSWDFPDFPSFWNPRFLSARGDRALLEAIPIGKDRREIFMIYLGPSEGERRPLTCPACGRSLEPGWKYCPYDGKTLSQGTRSR